MSAAECGTYAGYQAHLRRRQDACEPCRVAHNAYMRDFRARRPEIYRAELTANHARNRALWRLSKLYPEDFRRLVLEELGVEAAAS